MYLSLLPHVVFLPHIQYLILCPPQCGHVWCRFTQQAEIHWGNIRLIYKQNSLILSHPYEIAQTDPTSWSQLVMMSFVLMLPVSGVLESFLRNRSSLDHEATAMMKAQFMSLWDGLDTSSTTQVVQPELFPVL